MFFAFIAAHYFFVPALWVDPRKEIIYRIGVLGIGNRVSRQRIVDDLRSDNYYLAANSYHRIPEKERTCFRFQRINPNNKFFKPSK